MYLCLLAALPCACSSIFSYSPGMQDEASTDAAPSSDAPLSDSETADVLEPDLAKSCESDDQCDDDLTCTLDICDGTGRCQNDVQSGYCLIDNACIVDGASNPDDEDCQQCIHTLNADGWTTLSKCVRTLAGGPDPDETGGFNKPGAISLDGAGRIYVADSGFSRVRLLEGGNVNTFVGTDGTIPLDVLGPHGLLVDGNFLYIADTSRCIVRRIDLATNQSLEVAASPDCTTTDSTTNTVFPFAIAIANGTLYVADQLRHRIFSVNTNHSFELLSSSEQGFTNGPLDGARFWAPSDIAADNGMLYVADAGNNVVRSIDLTSGTVSILAGNEEGLSGKTNGDALTEARFDHPTGVVFHLATNSLFVADQGNHEIRRIELATHTVETYVGSNMRRQSIDGQQAKAGFYKPTRLAIDSTGILYVTEWHAVRSIAPPWP